MELIREERPLRVEIADAVYASLTANISISPKMSVMDYGCGTGLISVPLSQNVKTVYAVESSARQLEILSDKIDMLGISTIETVCYDLSKDPWPQQRVDVIFSSMTMHHIADTHKVLERFNQALEDNGYLAIADLDSEDGSFHKDNGDVAHYGFDRESLIAILQGTAFELVSCQTVHQIIKSDENGEEVTYPMFLLLARKVGDHIDENPGLAQ
jgi:2-polyprenyl-3-methyl-5-hydroxy-6-metoxy-1,4-benzoquinol methylase